VEAEVTIDQRSAAGDVSLAPGQSESIDVAFSDDDDEVVNERTPLALAEAVDGISLSGAGIAVQGVSDANGRFELESFPSGAVTFHCVVVSDGWYYYGDSATLDHSGPESVTLILRSVEDMKNGVPPSRIDRADDLRLARPVKRPPIR
jgi:hypothetical protein